MSGFLSRLAFLGPAGNIGETVRRFPLSVACSVLLFLLVIAISHEFIHEGGFLTGQVTALLACGYFWFGGAKLVAESRDWPLSRYLTLAVPVFAVLGVLLPVTDLWQSHLLFIVPALLLFVMVAPFTARGSGDDASFWEYNRALWSGVALGILAALIFAGGLSAALGSVAFLFEIKIPDKLFADIWAFASMLLAPFYALSAVPARFSASREGIFTPPGLMFLLNWILAPLIVLYFLILYAYAAKILVAGTLPQGQLAYMITGFGGAGIVFYLLAWPFREMGTRLLSLVHRHFFKALILPAGLLFVAIYVRISTYGVTEQRYIIVLAAVWLAVTAILFAVRTPPLKTIPALLAALFLLASFGPWGGVALSTHSQMARLQALLVKNGMLTADGRVAKAEGAVPFADRKAISSIIDYLASSDRKKLLQPLFAPGDGNWVFPGTHDAVQAMGFEYVSRWQDEEDARVISWQRSRMEKLIPVAGHDYLSPLLYAYQGGNRWMHDFAAFADAPASRLVYENGVLSVDAGESGTFLFRLEDYLSESALREKLASGAADTDLVMDSANAQGRARLVLESLQANVENGRVAVQGFSFYLLLDI